MDGLTVSVTRRGRVESRHAVDAVVAGDVVWAAGEGEARHFPCSAIKALLALPLVESGSAERFGLDDRALALACSSYDGSAEHVALARHMLERAGRSPDDLACGAHWPPSRDACHRLAAGGELPCPLNNDCSGKHAVLICLAVGLGLDPDGYELPSHGAMGEATASLERETGTTCDERNRAVDGCSIPTYALGLRSLARGFAGFGTGRGIGPARAAAAAQIRSAVASHPHLVSGVGRFDTVLNAALGTGAFVKGAAEGVWCASLPERGVGIAVKVRLTPARPKAAVAGLLARFGEAHPVLDDWPGRRLATWRGAPTGEVRVEPS